MGGICGWINWHPDGKNAAATLGGMLRQLAPNNDQPEHRHLSQNCALGAAGGLWDAHFFADDSLWVACYGEPRWGDSDRNLCAPERGAAAAIADAYRNHGSQLLRRLRGPVSIALIDLANRSALLAIDRLGIHSLHYFHRGDLLIFATQANAVATHPGARAEIDPQGIFDFLYFHVVPAPRTIYLDQKKLLPAQCVSLHQGQIVESYYWELQYQDTNHKRQEELEAEFRDLLRRSVGRVSGDAKTGTFLSGGTDSSTVTGILSETRGGPVDTYSIGFDVPGYDETSYARIAANHFRARHHEYRVTPQDVIEAASVIANGYDEPFGNSSAVPALFCARLAQRDGTTTLLAGDGGDEIFAGNERYAKQKLFELYGVVPKALRVVLAEKLFLHLPGRERILPIRKLDSYIRQARIPLPDRLQTYNFLHRTPLAEIFNEDFLRTINTQEPLELMREIYSGARSRSPLNRMMHLDLRMTLADNDLKKVSRMCELAGVRVRYPLLDEDLVEFAATVPPHLQLRGLQLRYFFKQSLKDFLPRQVLTKSKHGFGLPVGRWMGTDPKLQELVHESLGSFQARGVLRDSYLEELSRLHESDRGSYYGVMLWTLTILEQWLSHRGK